MFRIIVLILFVSTIATVAQTIEGTVSGHNTLNEVNTLSSANIYWKNTKLGTRSDIEGKFSLKRSKSSDTLIVSYTGYEKQEIYIPASLKNIDIVLQPNASSKEVVVTARQNANQINKSSIAHQEVVTSQGLRKAACCNLAESFETNASVDVHQTDAVTGARQIELLGLAGKYTQIMIEKIPSVRGLASTFGLNYIPGSWMESIQISKGASTVATGFESITGQINVEYKKPDNSPPVYANYYHNNFGMMEGNIISATKLSDNWSTALFLHGNYSNTEKDHNSDSFLDMPLTKQFNVLNRWKYMGNGFATQFGIQALYDDRKAGQIGFHSNDENNLYGIDIKTEKVDLFHKAGYVFDSEAYMSMAMIQNFTYHNQESFFGNRIYNAKQNTYNASIFFDAHLSAQTEEHLPDKLQLGINFIADNYDEVMSTINSKSQDLIPGLFAEYTTQIFPDLQVIAGLRADFVNSDLEDRTFISPRVHLKYNLDDYSSIRASLGKGYRLSHVFSEYPALLASSREFVIEDNNRAEEAINFGLHYTGELELFDYYFTLNAEYYYTRFQNQIVVDLDRDPGKVFVTNLEDNAYSNSFQVDLTMEVFEDFDVILAYRINDVKYKLDNEYIEKPLSKRHKAFVNLAYTTGENGFDFDMTFSYNGRSRLPKSVNENAYSPDYLTINAQVSKSFEAFEVYLGGENLTGYTQANPILGAETPFATGFDSSIVWGPINGAKIYAGTRITLFE